MESHLMSMSQIIRQSVARKRLSTRLSWTTGRDFDVSTTEQYPARAKRKIPAPVEIKKVWFSIGSGLTSCSSPLKGPLIIPSAVPTSAEVGMDSVADRITHTAAVNAVVLNTAKEKKQRDRKFP